MPESPRLTPGSALLTVPNMISFGRLCAVPVAIWLVLKREWALAFGLFAAAGISDAVDGWLARRQGGTSLGAALDPLADKTLLVGMYVTLAAIGALPSWIAILTVFRDLVIVGGVVLLWMYGHGATIHPILISKINTALQLGLVALVLGLNAFGFGAQWVRFVAIWLVAVSTAVSGGAYVYRTVRPA